jgi:hypothetical protein
MKPNKRNTLAAALLGAGIALAAAIPAAASPGGGFGPGMREMTPEMQERMRDRMQARFDKMAERLEIKASQRDAWQAYVKVHQAQIDGSMKPAPKDADAATIARHRADMANKMAQKLTVLADATAQLQQTLSPEQAKLLADMTRRPMGGRHGKHGGERSEHRRHGGEGRGMR